ncbi:MAG TPA: hypothetical protein VGR70_17180 [Stellaceae bacterium]|nr:hypothetical protein [Stellaceae bacterium]
MYARARDGLDLLSTKLWSLKKDYNWARSRGDSERVRLFEIQIKAITAERERLMHQLSTNMSRNLSPRGP